MNRMCRQRAYWPRQTSLVLYMDSGVHLLHSSCAVHYCNLKYYNIPSVHSGWARVVVSGNRHAEIRRQVIGFVVGREAFIASVSEPAPQVTGSQGCVGIWILLGSPAGKFFAFILLYPYDLKRPQDPASKAPSLRHHLYLHLTPQRIRVQQILHLLPMCDLGPVRSNQCRINYASQSNWKPLIEALDLSILILHTGWSNKKAFLDLRKKFSFLWAVYVAIVKGVDTLHRCDYLEKG